MDPALNSILDKCSILSAWSLVSGVGFCHVLLTHEYKSTVSPPKCHPFHKDQSYKCMQTQDTFFASSQYIYIPLNKYVFILNKIHFNV